MQNSWMEEVVCLPVLWGDMDALGHVNNARYFSWMESARIALIRACGVDTLGEGVSPVLATTQCNFIKPVVYPATVEVGVKATQIGNSSITMEYGVWIQGAPDSLVAQGTSVLVLWDFVKSSKVTVPESVRQHLEQLGRAP